jgi:hypothetical protein
MLVNRNIIRSEEHRIVLKRSGINREYIIKCKQCFLQILMVVGRRLQ